MKNIEREKNTMSSRVVCLLFHWLFLFAGLFNCLYGVSVCMSERFFFIVGQKYSLMLSQCLFTECYVFVYVRENNTHISATLRQKLHTNTNATELTTETTFFFSSFASFYLGFVWVAVRDMLCIVSFTQTTTLWQINVRSQ